MVPNASQISQFYHVQEHRISKDILSSWKHVLYSYTVVLKHEKEIFTNEGSGAFGQRSHKKESENSLRHSSIIESSGIGLRMRRWSRRQCRDDTTLDKVAVWPQCHGHDTRELGCRNATTLSDSIFLTWIKVLPDISFS